MDTGHGHDRHTADTARLIARGVARLLGDLDADCLFEFTLRTGRRVDAIGLDRRGAFTIVEIKSGVADFRSDTKWRVYTPFCDRFNFAVAMDFPLRILPETCGVIRADGFGGAVHREAPTIAMNAARRCALTPRFARTAATRLMTRATGPSLGL
jgi:hypothetical protein